MMDVPQAVVNSVVRQTVKKGDVYKIVMSEDDGITPKNGFSTRRKFFVVLGFDNDGNAYGGVVINSGINQNLPVVVQQYHMPIYAKNYSFLHHNSFVNCSNLLKASLDKLVAGSRLGQLSCEDFGLVCQTVCDSPNISKNQLKLYGIL